MYVPKHGSLTKYIKCVSLSIYMYLYIYIHIQVDDSMLESLGPLNSTRIFATGSRGPKKHPSTNCPPHGLSRGRRPWSPPPSRKHPRNSNCKSNRKRPRTINTLEHQAYPVLYALCDFHGKNTPFGTSCMAAKSTAQPGLRRTAARTDFSEQQQKTTTNNGKYEATQHNRTTNTKPTAKRKGNQQPTTQHTLNTHKSNKRQAQLANKHSTTTHQHIKTPNR